MAMIRFIPSDKAVFVADGTNLLEAARKAGVSIEAPCDGTGTCGKCRVKIPATQQRNFEEAPHEWLTQAERGEGWALACQSTVQGDLLVEPDSCADDDLKILSEGHIVTVELDAWITKTFDASAARTTVTAGGALLATEPGDTTAALFGAAVDIGTTTLVVALIDLRDGRELAIASSLNPQARHAQDVLSRIKLGSQPQGLQLLHGELIGELNRLVGAAAAEADVPVRHIYEAVFSGNTTMLHLATATNPASLGKYPYTPALQGGQHVGAAGTGLSAADHVGLCGRGHHVRHSRDEAGGAARRDAVRGHRHQRRNGAGGEWTTDRDVHRRRAGLRGHEHRLRHEGQSRRHRTGFAFRK